MCPWFPWELVAEPLEYAGHTLGTDALTDLKVWRGLNRLLVHTNGLAFVYTVTTSRFHKRRHLLSNLGIKNIQQFGANMPTSQPVLTQ